jgi:hypothetical protein
MAVMSRLARAGEMLKNLVCVHHGRRPTQVLVVHPLQRVHICLLEGDVARPTPLCLGAGLVQDLVRPVDAEHLSLPHVACQVQRDRARTAPHVEDPVIGSQLG